MVSSGLTIAMSVGVALVLGGCAASRLAEKARADAELAELEAQKTERGLMITLEDVLFEFGKAGLEAGSVRGLDRLVSLLNEYPERNLVIEGNTDSIGADASNDAPAMR